MTPLLTMQSLNRLCKNIKNWNKQDIEKRFCGSSIELLEALNNCEEIEKELFFSGFLCDNPVIALAADNGIDPEKLSNEEKISLFINRGLVLCYFTNHEPGFVVKPYWMENHSIKINKD